MTRLRRDPDAVSNYFDGLFHGIGERGSSFMDVDGLVHLAHNGRSGRFLFMEFKNEEEALPNKGETWALKALSCLPGCESWVLRRNGANVEVHICQKGSVVWSGTSSETQAQTLFASWWAGKTEVPVEITTVTVGGCPHENVYPNDAGRRFCSDCGEQVIAA